MKHYGDITKISGYDLPIVDVITGGSPCQDLSVAGKRAGLAGERSGLFMEQMRIVKEMREHDKLEGRPAHLCRPRFMVWENVPGAFSSAGGKDFAAVLEEILKVTQENAHVDVPEQGWTHSGCIFSEDGRASVAWRLHDAQFWGVPQRRKRIALVADFGGLAAPEILFERKGLSWHPESSGEAGESAAAGTEDGAGEPSVAGTLDASYYKGCGERNGTERDVVCFTNRGYDKPGSVPDALRSNCHGAQPAISFQERAGKPGGGKGILIQNEHTGALSTLTNQSVLQPQTIPINTMVATRDTPEMRTTFGVGEPDDPQFTISAAHEHAVFSAVTIPIEGNGTRESHRGDGYGKPGDASFTLNSVEQHAVFSAGFSFGQSAQARSLGYQEEMAPTLKGGEGGNQKPVVLQSNE